MKKFYFTRNITVEEFYCVTMSDELGHPGVAKQMLQRQLGNEELTEATELLESKVVHASRAREKII